MVAKAVLVFCAQALLAQCISSQCIGAGGWGWGPVVDPIAAPWDVPVPYVPETLIAPWAGIPCATGYGPAALTASNGGGFPITSISPIGITGISMTSENAYEGPISVSGTIPFLGAVALEGAVPTAGSGGVAYGCGNGNIAMLTEDIAPVYNPYVPYPVAEVAYPPVVYEDIVGPYAGPYTYGPGVVLPELGYPYAPVVYETDIVGPAYGYNGCGCGVWY